MIQYKSKLGVVFIAVLFLLIFVLTSCKKKPAQIQTQKPIITLTYYKLYENEENLNQMFSSFSQKFPYVRIEYKKFVDREHYLETIVNEIAEGGGPDIMSVPNTWVRQNYKKLTPAPANVVSASVYRDTLVDVAAKDNIIKDSNGKELTYGIPLSVDSLALYYNDKHFEAEIPERGKPAPTWNGIKADSVKLTKLNPVNDTDIIKSAIAMGRGDNIVRAGDIFFTLALQNEIKLYNENFTEFNFSNTDKVLEILDFIAGFADPANSYYSWNEKIISSQSPRKEIEAFVTGKTSMIFGYSYLYKDILKLINIKKRSGVHSIDISDVKITTVPQKDFQNKAAYANYFTEVVSRNTKHPQEAWLLLTHMIEKQNLQSLYARDFKPTSRRDIIPSQRLNPIFSAFVEQIGYSDSYLMFDNKFYNNAIKETLNMINSGENISRAINITESNINSKMPNEGVYPIPEAKNPRQ